MQYTFLKWQCYQTQDAYTFHMTYLSNLFCNYLNKDGLWRAPNDGVSSWKIWSMLWNRENKMKNKKIKNRF